MIVALIYGAETFVAQFEANKTETKVKEFIKFYPHINSDKVNYSWTFGDDGGSN